MSRAAPQTAYSIIADDVAASVSLSNKQLPPPAYTERKRSQNQQLQISVPENNKNLQFRVPEPPKADESKKRKLPFCMDNCTAIQHLMGPPKISRIQQIYR